MFEAEQMKKLKPNDFGKDLMMKDCKRRFELHSAIYAATKEDASDVVVSMKLTTSREFELLLIGIASRLAMHGDSIWSAVLLGHMEAALPHLAEGNPARACVSMFEVPPCR
jgi:hypothetical protein